MHIIAHRGACKQFLENSLEAIQRAIALNVYAIEVDIHLSKDRVPVLSHDASLQRLAGSHQLVRNLTYQQLKELTLFGGYKIASLEEILALDFKNSKLMIEIKEGIFDLPDDPRLLAVGSFSQEIIDHLLHSPLAKKTVSIVETKAMLEHFMQKNIARFAVWWPLINEELVKRLHAAKREIWAFTVNGRAERELLESWQVDAIIVDM